ncbi:MAG: acetyl-CoA carboxylase carboxyltransferase subunit alpha/beta [Actinobacteria bacterium]|nr:acetyl-CoA carboxylase carboxyltransferase subunit alpha/beta [Actinomycetota bacterium]
MADDGSFTVWDDDLTSNDPLGFTDARSYRDRLQAAAEGDTAEAVVTGSAHIVGREVALLVGAFEFLAGTQGVVVGERVARAFERAANRGLPVLGMPASGGTRMQEGSLAFVQMLKIAAVVGAYRRGGGRYVAWLRHPTTGGALASWGSLAQITWAQPGALIGLTGPRVIEQLYGEALPDHVQRAEHLCAHGVVDDVVAGDQLATRLPGLLDSLGPPPTHAMAPFDAGDVGRTRRPLPTLDLSGQDSWTAVERSRAPDRPGLPALLDAAARDIVVVQGDGAGGRDDGCVTVVCTFRGIQVVLVGHDRPAGQRGASLDAVGYRSARNAMRLADELGLPLVTVVDTEGAAATVGAEEGGIAAEIAGCMATMSGLTVPTVAVLLGEGSGGGAIAWLPADRVIAPAHAWLAPIAPEGASSILFRTTDRAPEIANAQAIDVVSLRAIGLVDEIIDDHRGWVSELADTVADQLRDLAAQPVDERLTVRYRRLRSLAAAAG